MKGLKFSDSQNLTDDAIRMGVTEDAPRHESLRNMPSYEAPASPMQHEKLVSDDET